MNPILEKWLAERQAEVKKAREKFLIEQGLVDPSKTKTIFKDVLGNVLTEEEAKQIKANGQRVYEDITYDVLDLTEEEYNQVLTYAQPQALNNGEPTDHELLQRISRHTGIVSTVIIVYVILSVIFGIILEFKTIF